ncbi:hypothetical protein [Ancylobacter lacus]|uniref:hypothetical protein n=1 Tax=Ancylobacter lacus TaxID=2579970 RepID=UPI001BCF5F02|nr:hypothetical protein [Ancylobacter lacus]MBS7538347.1 hypothetical protein [Ancylobacter lacus]
MDLGKYGPFAETIAIAGCLIAVFSFLLLKMVGKISRWTYLIEDTPPFIVTLAVRGIAIGLIAVTFLTITKENVQYFQWAAVGFGSATMLFLILFDGLRRKRTCKIPEVGADGRQKKSWLGKLQSRTVVIGAANRMRADARTAFEAHPGLSVEKFMSGYGYNEVNNPKAIWDADYLAGIAQRMTILLMGVLLCSVMTLYLAAASIEVRQHDQSGPTKTTPGGSPATNPLGAADS